MKGITYSSGFLGVNLSATFTGRFVNILTMYV